MKRKYHKVMRITQAPNLTCISTWYHKPRHTLTNLQFSAIFVDVRLHKASAHQARGAQVAVLHEGPQFRHAVRPANLVGRRGHPQIARGDVPAIKKQGTEVEGQQQGRKTSSYLFHID